MVVAVVIAAAVAVEIAAAAAVAVAAATAVVKVYFTMVTTSCLSRGFHFDHMHSCIHNYVSILKTLDTLSLQF